MLMFLTHSHYSHRGWIADMEPEVNTRRNSRAYLGGEEEEEGAGRIREGRKEEKGKTRVKANNESKWRVEARGWGINYIWHQNLKYLTVTALHQSHSFHIHHCLPLAYITALSASKYSFHVHPFASTISVDVINATLIRERDVSARWGEREVNKRKRLKKRRWKWQLLRVL